MPKVLVTEPLPGDAVEWLSGKYEVTIAQRGTLNSEDDLIRAVPEFDALLTLLTNPVTAKVLDAAPNLKIVANCAVGYNNIDIDAAATRQIKVANTPDVLTDATADLAFGLILSVTRQMGESEQYLRAGKFDDWMPKGFLGMELNGSNLGIVGMGRIGKALSKRAQAFGMDIGYFNRSRLSQQAEAEAGATYFPTVDKLAQWSDVLSIHCPLNEHSHHLINKDVLKQLGPNGYLINTARGPVVDEAALAEALHDQNIAGAGIDVFEKEPEVHPRLLSAPHAVLLPHIGSATFKTRSKMVELAVSAIDRVFQGTPEKAHNLVV